MSSFIQLLLPLLAFFQQSKQFALHLYYVIVIIIVGGLSLWLLFSFLSVRTPIWMGGINLRSCWLDSLYLWEERIFVDILFAQCINTSFFIKCIIIIPRNILIVMRDIIVFNIELSLGLSIPNKRPDVYFLSFYFSSSCH